MEHASCDGLDAEVICEHVYYGRIVLSLYRDSAPGAAPVRAEQHKAATYPELVASPCLRLVTVATEVGGRMSSRCAEILTSLAHARARQAVRIECCFYSSPQGGREHVYADRARRYPASGTPGL